VEILESFLFRCNEGLAEIFQILGLEFHALSLGTFILMMMTYLLVMYLLVKLKVPQRISSYDKELKYTPFIIMVFLIGVLYFMAGLLLLLAIALVGGFYAIVVMNKKYEWLREIVDRYF